MQLTSTISYGHFFPDDANKEVDKASRNQSLNTFIKDQFITGKHLDPTNVNKLIRVEPWALDNQEHVQDNHSADQDIQTPEPDQNITRISTVKPQYSVGDFVVFELPGSDNLIDNDV